MQETVCGDCPSLAQAVPQVRGLSSPTFSPDSPPTTSPGADADSTPPGHAGPGDGPASHSSSEGGAETTSYRPLLRPPSPGDDTEKARLPGPWQWGGMPNCRRVRPPLPSRAVWSKARGGQLRGMSHRGSRAPSKF